MPQLVPFYFFNQITFAFVLLIITVYVFSIYILARFVRLFLLVIFLYEFIPLIVGNLELLSLDHQLFVLGLLAVFFFVYVYCISTFYLISEIQTV